MTQAIEPIRLAGRHFTGTGDPSPDPLPEAWRQPEPYVAPPALRQAVNMALFLSRPLLVEGEPGTGKTRLAYAVARELGYPLKEIYIRSTSRAEDLLYTFDAVRRLYDIQERRAIQGDGTMSSEPYVELGKLGEAIDLSVHDTPCVVLIDEIDKADIDFPNDLLLVLDRLQFEVKEVRGRRYDALGDQTREQRRLFLPLVIVTSNREKELPAAFLRRCLYYFIPFPDQTELATILARHHQQELTPLFSAALTRFWELRHSPSLQWRKAPSTSEFLDWVRLLERDEQRDLIRADVLATLPLDQLPSLEALVKTQSDREALTGLRPAERIDTSGSDG